MMHVENVYKEVLEFKTLNTIVRHRWFGVQKETIGLHANSTGLSGYCRGDEQLVTHCQWKLPNPTLCSYLLAIQCGGE